MVEGAKWETASPPVWPGHEMGTLSGAKWLRQGGGKGFGVAGVVPVYKRDAEQTANNNNHFAPVAIAA